VASLLTAPCDAIKQRLQIDASRTLRGEVSRVLKSPKPLAGFFVGYPQFLLRDLPFDAIQMTSFEALKRWHASVVEPGRPRTAGENAMLGGVAGAVTGLVTTPLDVARTAEVCALSAGVKCKGMACLAALVRRGGAGVLLRGSLPRMVEISLGGVLYFSASEAVKKALGLEEEETDHPPVAPEAGREWGSEDDAAVDDEQTPGWWRRKWLDVAGRQPAVVIVS